MKYWPFYIDTSKKIYYIFISVFTFLCNVVGLQSHLGISNISFHSYVKQIGKCVHETEMIPLLAYKIIKGHNSITQEQ